MTKLTPHEVLTGKDPGLGADVYVGNHENNFKVLTSFIMRYLICAYPSKEAIKKALQLAHYKRYNELNGERPEADYDHKSLLCFMTASDLAFVLWQYRNSYKDWAAKVTNQGNRYKCGTRWTSNKKVIGASDQGMEAYKECLDWSKQLMKMSDSHEFWRLRWQCNEKAGDLGYLREWGEIVGEDGEGGGTFEGYGGSEEPETVPSYGEDEWDDIPALAV